MGVENVNVATKSFADITFNATGIAGVDTTITLSNTQAGGTTAGDITNVATGAKIVAGAGVTGTLSAALATDASGVQVEGGSAATVSVTAITDKGVSIKTGATTTAINLDATATINTTDKATISAAGTVALDNEVNTNRVVENLTLSGNGAAVTFNLADAATAANTLKTVALVGDQNVTLNASAVALAGQTVTDGTTGTSTTKVIVSGTYAAGTHNLDKVAADQIQLVSAAAGGTTFNLIDNSNVLVGLDAAGTVAVDSTAAADLTLNSIKSGNVDTAETLNIRVASSQSANDLIVSDFETVHLTIDDGKAAKNTITIADLVASTASNGVVNVSGSDNLTLTAVTAKKLDATNLQGALTATLSSTAADIKGGAGDDVISIATDVDFKVDGGAGVNTLKFGAANNYSDNTVSFTNVGLLHIDVAAATTVQFKSSDVTGKAFALKGDATVAADTLQINMDAASVDLGGIAVDTATANVTVVTQNVATTVVGTLGADTVNHAANSTSLTFTSTAGNDVITGGSAADTITTGAGADVVKGGAGNDTITVGEGSDFVEGGAGADTINLTETVSAIDYVNFAALTDGSAAGAAAGTFTGYDVITGFKTGTDKLVFGSDGAATPVTITTRIIDGAAVVKAGDAATDASKDLTFADIANVDKLVAYLNEAGVAYTPTTSKSDLVAITFGDKTALYAVTNDATAAVVATEIKLLGTVDALLVAGDLVIA